MMRTRPILRVGVSVMGCRAATGATLVARRAGDRAAKVVTTIPTMSGMMHDITVTLTEASTGEPAALSPMSMSWVTPIPRAVPTADPMRPAVRASPTTERRTCLRVAPIQRAKARVRVRWATRMVKVLTITIAATARAMTAKAPMKVVMAANPSEACSAWWARSSSAVRTVAVLPTALEASLTTSEAGRSELTYRTSAPS